MDGAAGLSTGPRYPGRQRQEMPGARRRRGNVVRRGSALPPVTGYVAGRSSPSHVSLRTSSGSPASSGSSGMPAERANASAASTT